MNKAKCCGVKITNFMELVRQKRLLLNTTNNCAPASQSSDAFMGYSSLEVSYSVDNDTRFLYLNYEIPDVDSQSGRSYAFGYRVCRGSC